MFEKNDKLIYKLVDDLLDSMTFLVNGDRVFRKPIFESLSNFDLFYIAEILLMKGYRKIDCDDLVLSNKVCCDLVIVLCKKLLSQFVEDLKPLLIERECKKGHLSYMLSTKTAIECVDVLAKQYGV